MTNINTSRWLKFCAGVYRCNLYFLCLLYVVPRQEVERKDHADRQNLSKVQSGLFEGVRQIIDEPKVKNLSGFILPVNSTKVEKTIMDVKTLCVCVCIYRNTERSQRHPVEDTIGHADNVKLC